MGLFIRPTWGYSVLKCDVNCVAGMVVPKSYHRECLPRDMQPSDVSKICLHLNVKIISTCNLLNQCICININLYLLLVLHAPTKYETCFLVKRDDIILENQAIH